MTGDKALPSEWSKRLVEALVASGELELATARSALERSSATGAPVALLLVQTGVIGGDAALECLSSLSGMDHVDLKLEVPTRAAASVLPVDVARQHQAIGLRLEQGYVLLACAEPLRADQLRAITTSIDVAIGGCVLADAALIERAIDDDARSRVLVHEQEEAMRLTSRTHAQDLPLSGKPVLQSPTASARPVLRDVPVQSLADTLLEPEFLAQLATLDPPLSTSSLAAARSAWDLDDDEVRQVPAQRQDAGAPGHHAASSPGLPGGPDIDQLLIYAVENGASDLHLAARFPPAVRIDGSIRPIEHLAPLDPTELRRMVFDVLPQAVRERFEATKELDTSYEIPGVGRFRMSVLQQRGSIGAVLRMIPPTVPPLDSLALPASISSLGNLRRGLVLVTGPTGSGKSTTLAGIIDQINASKPLHIMTVEDPIEFQHNHKRSIVNQREVGQDTSSFAECLRHTLRQDPDVILVGEMRDLETISTALTAAETGHLVFATLHTQDAPQTIDRIVDVFPANQQDQVRVQLAAALEAVVTQQLVISAGGEGRTPVVEVMMCTPGIRNLIRQAKTHQIYSLMQTGGSSGMQTMDQALAQAVRDGKITENVAFDRAHDPKELLDYLKG